MDVKKLSECYRPSNRTNVMRSITPVCPKTLFYTLKDIFLENLSRKVQVSEQIWKLFKALLKQQSMIRTTFLGVVWNQSLKKICCIYAL